MNETVNTVVVTAVISSVEGGEPAVNYSVLVDGRAVEAQVGLILTGAVSLVAHAGVTDTTQMRAMSGLASRFADAMNDRVLGLMLEALAAQQAPVSAPAELAPQTMQLEDLDN